jgi:hypothetical protein
LHHPDVAQEVEMAANDPELVAGSMEHIQVSKVSIKLR